MTDTLITVNGEPLAITWGSNSPINSNGGYGMTTGLVCRSLRDVLGCRMSVSATYGHYCGKIVWHGIPVYPPGALPFGNDIHAANAAQERAHLLLTHQDVWTQYPDHLTRNGTRWVPYFPIDGSPLSPEVAKRLDPDFCYQPIAVSRYGERVARAAGIDIRCVPQGIKATPEGDAEMDRLFPPFVPGDRVAAREQLGWPQDAFIVGMVAQNSGYPNRKAYPQQLRAFRAFAERHTDAMLYLHAFGDRLYDGRVETRLAWHLGERLHDIEKRVIWSHPYDLNMGYSQADMVLRYQAMDVYLGVAMAEGFGIPIVEAQACGVPVITGGWSAMSEVMFAGWSVPIEDSEPWYVDPLETVWRLPHERAIDELLEIAYGTLANRDERDWLTFLARSGAVLHDQRDITNTHWRAVLAELAQRIEAEPTPWHRHRWSDRGTLITPPTPPSGGARGGGTGGGVVVPCLVDGCPAEAQLTATGAKQIHPAGAPIVIDGIALDIQDDPRGGVARLIANDIVNVYRLQDIELQPGDIVVDVGAHVGVVSCYLAKKFPAARIFAFEPVPANFERLIRNLDANGCVNVFAYHDAITSDGRDLELRGDPTTNTGGYGAWISGPVIEHVTSRRLYDVWGMEGWGRIALLKLDCEGAEYEILRGLGSRLDQVTRLVMEVHENDALRAAHGLGNDLVRFVRAYVPTVRASIIQIADADVETQNLASLHIAGAV